MLISQRRRSAWIPWAIIGLGLITAVVVTWLYARAYAYTSTPSIFDDVVAHAKFSRFVGVISDWGIALWMAMALFFLQALYRLMRSPTALTRKDYIFYLSMFLGCLYLALDDRLLIHEWIAGHWPIHELVIMGTYAGIGLVCGVLFWRYIKQGPLRWLGVAALTFSLSIFADTHFFSAWMEQGFADPLVANPTNTLIEEGLKWIGILALLVYVLVLTAHPPTMSAGRARKR